MNMHRVVLDSPWRVRARIAVFRKLTGRFAIVDFVSLDS